MIFDKKKRCKIKKGSYGASSKGHCYGYVDMEGGRYAIIECDDDQPHGLWRITSIMLQETKWRDMQSVLNSPQKEG